MYQKVSTDLKFVDREKEVEKFWEENQIFEKSMENRKEGETYTFYDGPPTANGKPHIGHVLTRVIKDMDWSLLLTNVRKVSGNIKECGRISLLQSDSGRIWSILTLPTTITSSSPSGGR